MQLRPFVYDQSTNTVVPAGRQTAAPLTQDLEANAWGFGVRGLRVSAATRLRGSLGSDLVWPRSADHFDLLWAFAELDRGAWRLRAGRLQRPGPLGFVSFDGASALVRPASWLRAEAYGGRSLVRGTSDPGTAGAIAAVDSLLPNSGALVAGVSAWADPWPAASFSAGYQREVTSGFEALVSERASFDARVGLGSRASLHASTDINIADDAWGNGNVRLSLAPSRAARVDAAVFRYRPFFGLNTIWGVFNPQAHWGTRVALSARLPAGFAADASYTMRRYRPTTETTPFLTSLEDVTHVIELGGRYATGPWALRASWRLTDGWAGAQSSGEGGVEWDRGGDVQLGATVGAFQESEQLRVGGGTVLGLGLHGRARLRERATLRAQLTHWRHQDTRGSAAPDWSQLRGLVALEISFGANADQASRPR